MILHALIQAHAETLAQHLGHSAEEILKRGLSAHDFKDTLHFEFADHSEATFHYALFIHLPTEKQVAVFTEHCGHFCFPQWVRIRSEGDVVFNGLGEH